MALPDRIDPRPPRRIYRWDLDKTYLQTEFDTVRQLVRTALQKASEKQAVPGRGGADPRAPRAGRLARSASSRAAPRQMRNVLEAKLKLDGVEWDELVLKDNVRNLLRGRFRALRGQVGYKLPVLLESRDPRPGRGARRCSSATTPRPTPSSTRSTPTSSPAGSTRRCSARCSRRRRSTRTTAARIVTAWRAVPRGGPGAPHLHPPRPAHPAGATSPATARGWCRSSTTSRRRWCCSPTAQLTAAQVARVAVEMVQTAGHNLLTLSNSLPGPGPAWAAHPGGRRAAAAGAGGRAPGARMPSSRHSGRCPDIVKAFTRRVAALGATASAPRSAAHRLPERPGRRASPDAPRAEAP